MADDLKNTGKGNLFVIFGEPDISVVSGQWLVARDGRMVANYEHVKELSGLGSLEEINRLGGADLPRFKRVPAGREVWDDKPDATGGGVRAGEHRRGGGTVGDRRVLAVPERGERVPRGSGDAAGGGRTPATVAGGGDRGAAQPVGGDQPHARWAKAIAAIQGLSPAEFPLTLTTSHYAQVTIHGVDVFHPNTGEVRSDGADGIACWFIDTDYNEESFFVRHAYFLGANDPYKSLKTTLKAEIHEEAWSTLHSDTSRPFAKPKSGRIAVKVINHLGDEVMKVFRVK
jgi:adenine-specific DNA-methyltransferase